MKNILAVKNYKIGCSLRGVLAVVLIMLPNVLYLFDIPPNDVLRGNEANFWLWNVLENMGRFGLILTLCVIVNKTACSKNWALIIFALFSLLTYYVLWFLYFVGIFHGVTLVGLAVFPSAYFLLVAWRQRNIFALAFSLLFAIMHISITSSNFLF